MVPFRCMENVEKILIWMKPQTPKLLQIPKMLPAESFADLEEGTKLPVNMGAIGKFNKTVSQILLAKAMMEMEGDYSGALTILKDAQANGKKPNVANIGLAPIRRDIRYSNRNASVSRLYCQYSVNDNSGGTNGGNGEVLNFPYKGGSQGRLLRLLLTRLRNLSTLSELPPDYHCLTSAITMIPLKTIREWPFQLPSFLMQDHWIQD